MSSGWRRSPAPGFSQAPLLARVFIVTVVATAFLAVVFRVSLRLTTSRILHPADRLSAGVGPQAAPAARHQRLESFDFLHLRLCRAAAARAGTGDAGCRLQRLDAIELRHRAAQPALPRRLQHRRPHPDRPGRGPDVRLLRRPSRHPGPGDHRQAAGSERADLLPREHGIGRDGGRAQHAAAAVERLALELPVDGAELLRRRRRGGGGGGDVAGPAGLAGAAGRRTGLSDVPLLPHLRRPHRLREAAQRRSAAAARRGAAIGTAVRAGRRRLERRAVGLGRAARRAVLLGALEADDRPRRGRERVRSRAVAQYVHEEDRSGLRAALDAHLGGSSPHFEHQYRVRHVNGEIRCVLCRGIAVRDQAGKPIRMAGSQTDVTEWRRVQDTLARAARHDPLTGLPNRCCSASCCSANRQANRRTRRATPCCSSTSTASR